MGKRKHKDSYEHIKKKFRKYEERLRRYKNFDSSSDSDSDNRLDGSPDQRDYGEDNKIFELSNSHASSPNLDDNLRSAIHVVDVHNEFPNIECDISNTTAIPSATVQTTAVDSMPSTSGQNTSVAVDDKTPATLPADILDVLGESKGKQEVFGPKIQEEVSKRWGRILCEGLNKDQKKDLMGKILVPSNFQLVKAPRLNPEIAAVLIESTRNRDKRLEKAKNQLGIGISAITSIISSLIDNNLDKMEIIKKLSEANQILLDLHFESTINRRKLISYVLDKKFQDMIDEVQRDSLLFGENLTDKIKASKSAEKSGLQIKKVSSVDTASSKKPVTHQGNWRGPPRQSHRGNRRGGFDRGPTKGRSTYQSTKRSAPPTDRYQAPPKNRSKTNPKTQ